MREHVTYRKVGNHTGVLVKVVTTVPGASPSLPKTPAREIPIRNSEPTPDWSALSKKGQLGGEVCDVISRTRTFLTIDGVRVAALRLVLYVEYDKETSRAAGCKPDVAISDALTVHVYRNPKSPRHFNVRGW